MSLNFTGKAYYIFMFLLPLLFFAGISDMVLLPRQLFLTAFSTLLLIFVWKSYKNDFKPIELDAATLAMVAYFLIAVVISLSNAVVLSESLYSLSKLWILISFSLLTIWLLRKNAITINQIIKAVIIFGCVAIITAVIDIAEKTVRGQHLFRSIQNISGGFANKNLLSSILFLCLPFFMIGCHEKKRLRLISALALALAIVILLIIRTRTTLIATFAFFAIISFFLLRDILKRKIWWVIIIFVGVSVFAFLKFRLDEAIGGLKSSSDIKRQYFYRLFDTETFKTRVMFWQNSLEMVREHPFGVGLGNWQIHFPKYGLQKFDFEIANGIHTLQRPHNDFLWILCETGIIGFAAFTAIFIIILYQSYSLIKTAATKYDRRLFIYLFSALVGFIIIAFFDFPMERIEHQVILMLVFAIVIYQYGLTNNDRFAFPVKKILMMLFVIIGICFSSLIAFQRFESEREMFHLYAARKSGDSNDVMRYSQNAENSLYKIDSKTIPLQWYLGTAYFSQGQFSESESSFKEAYALTPYNIHVINNLASCYEVNGQRSKAIEMYQEALQISPMFEEARLNLAAVYFNDKAYEKAFQTIDNCDVNTRDPKHKIFLPPILKAKVDLVLATTELQIADDIRKTFGDAQYHMQLYIESKKNNITFEKQIINVLKK